MGGAGPAPHLHHRAAQAVQLPERAADGALPLGGPGAQGAGAPGAGAPAPGPEPSTGYWPPGPPVRHEDGRTAAGGAGAPGSRQLQLEVAGGGPVRGAARGAARRGEPGTLVKS